MNVLIALIDPAHVTHDKALQWFDAQGRQSWATCPITENGALRIVGHPSYGNHPGPPGGVARYLFSLRHLDGHEFWHDDLSLLDSELVESASLPSANRLTDTYLLALAVSRNGHLATFDRRMSTAAVRGGARALTLIL